MSASLVFPRLALRRTVPTFAQSSRLFASEPPTSSSQPVVDAAVNLLPIRDQLKTALKTAMKARDQNATTIVKVSLGRC